MASVEITSLEQFEEFVSTGYAVVDCYGDFCAACVMLAPVFESAVSDMAEIKFGKVNITNCMEVAAKFQINAMPTILFFRDGEQVHMAMGSLNREELDAQIAVMLYE